MDFITAKETLIRQCSSTSRLSLNVQPAEDAVEAFEEFLQLAQPIKLTVRQANESLTVVSDSPIACHLGFIAHDAPQIYDPASSHVDQLILENRIRDLISVSEQIMTVTHTEENSRPIRSSFRASLYEQRLATCIWAFSLGAKSKTPKTGEEDGGVYFSYLQRTCTIYALFRSCIKRGMFPALLNALTSLDRGVWDDNEECEVNLTTVLDAVKAACCKPRSRAMRPVLGTVGSCWHQLFNMLFAVAQRLPDAQARIVKTVCDVVTGTAAELQLVNDASLAQCVKKEVFSHMTTAEATPRSVLRFLFGEIVETIWKASSSRGNEIPCLKYLFKEVFSRWGDAAFAAKGPLDVNTTVMNAVMYSLRHLHHKFQTLPSAYLGSLLNGVTARLDSARSDALRHEGMTVAAAFAAYFVPDEETSNALFSEQQFAALFEKWNQEEVLDTPSGVSANKAPTDFKINLSQHSVCRTASRGDVFPLNPDDAYHYFSTSSELSEKIRVNAGTQLQVSRDENDVAQSLLPVFGVQRVEKDELGERVQVMETLRDSYNILLGVGRSPNAQMHELQENIESGLRGLSQCFHSFKDSKILGASVQREIDGMITTLLPTLLTLQIHAPEAKSKLLSHIRHQTIVDLIYFSPKITLFLLSQVIYSANYSVFQRTHVVKAMGEAAQQLAHVHLTSKSGTDENSDTSVTTKRLYPPIPRATATSSNGQSIVISEGANTRRWGNAVAGRGARQKTFENRLAEHADTFMAALLSKNERDHFKFFQDNDPYTPSEILKTIMIVLQGCRTARHVVGSLSQQALDFLITILATHPHDSVRRLAWLVTNEAMRAWCGAGPLIDAETNEMRGTHATVGSSRVNTSLLFSQEWMESLEALQVVCARISKKGDSCSNIATLVVSGMRDLVCETADLDEMRSHYAGSVMEI